MIDLKQGYFLVIKIERKVRIDIQQLCTIIIITYRLVVIASCIVHHNKGKTTDYNGIAYSSISPSGPQVIGTEA